MKKKLLLLSSDTLKRIASDMGIEGGEHKEIATKLCLYLKSYNLNWKDLAARYQL